MRSLPMRTLFSPRCLAPSLLLSYYSSTLSSPYFVLYLVCLSTIHSLYKSYLIYFHIFLFYFLIYFTHSFIQSVSPSFIVQNVCYNYSLIKMFLVFPFLIYFVHSFILKFLFRLVSSCKMSVIITVSCEFS